MSQQIPPPRRRFPFGLPRVPHLEPIPPEEGDVSRRSTQDLGRALMDAGAGFIHRRALQVEEGAKYLQDKLGELREQVRQFRDRE